MNAIDIQREEFRKYLDDSGVITALSKALIKLFDAKEKPKNAVEFVRQHMIDSDDDGEDCGDQKVSNTNDDCIIIKQHESEISVEKLQQEESVIDDQKRENDRAPFQELEINFKSKPLLEKYLTKDVFESVQQKETQFGSTIHDCLNADHIDEHHIGLIAPDANAYIEFANIFHPIICDIHGVDAVTMKQYQLPEWGDTKSFENFNTNSDSVLSILIECRRSVNGYPFLSKISDQNFSELRNKIRDKLTTQNGQVFDLPEDNEKFDDYKASVNNLSPLNNFLQRKFEINHESGVFVNENNKLLILINHFDDHLVFISGDQSGDIETIYRQLIDSVNSLSSGDEEDTLSYSYHEQYGWLTSSPANLGTTLNILVMLKLTKYTTNTEKINEICNKYNVNVTKKVQDDTTDDIYELVNSRKLAATEYQIVKDSYDAIMEIITLEREE